jgi:hypothetical protein
MQASELSLGRSVKFNFYDIFDVVELRQSKPGLTIRKRRDRPTETYKSGIYVWHHPDFGYFYVGIAAKNNFVERWSKHIQKLLDQCTSAKQMRNWKTFSDKFKSSGYGVDDLKNITLRFFPIADYSAYPNREEFKKALENLESRIIRMINPACNYEHNPNKPSATKYPQQKNSALGPLGYS